MASLSRELSMTHHSKAVQGHRTSGRRSLGEGASKTLRAVRRRVVLPPGFGWPAEVPGRKRRARQPSAALWGVRTLGKGRESPALSNAPESGAGAPQSKTLRAGRGPSCFRQVLDCASPLALSYGVRAGLVKIKRVASTLRLLSPIWSVVADSSGFSLARPRTTALPCRSVATEPLLALNDEGPSKGTTA
jgi:hypothetical protein